MTLVTFIIETSTSRISFYFIIRMRLVAYPLLLVIDCVCTKYLKFEINRRISCYFASFTVTLVMFQSGMFFSKYFVHTDVKTGHERSRRETAAIVGRNIYSRLTMMAETSWKWLTFSQENKINLSKPGKIDINQCHISLLNGDILYIDI
jgi:hypothetical protein